MKAQAESRQTLVLGVYAREFPGGLLKLDPAFAYAEPPGDVDFPTSPACLLSYLAKCHWGRSFSFHLERRDGPFRSTGTAPQQQNLWGAAISLLPFSFLPFPMADPSVKQTIYPAEWTQASGRRQCNKKAINPFRNPY